MIEKNVALAPLTTFKVGGPAAFFSVVSTEAELQEVVTYAKEMNVPFKILGGGSNVLVSDDGFAGFVIKNEIKGLSTEIHSNGQVLLRAGAGEVLDEVVKETVAADWWGLENLSHIPGTVGATPVQNVGAYGVEVKDLITTVRVLDTSSMQYKELTNTECIFGYRDSVFKHEAGAMWVVTAVTYSLSAVPTPRLAYKDLQQFFMDTEPSQAAIRDAVIAIRSKKFPDWHKVGTAGSFFKNPVISRETYQSLKEQYPELPSYSLPSGEVKIPLGWVLDKVVGIKEMKHSSVRAYEGQALVIINKGDATARDIIEFADLVTEKVKEATGISIEWEVTRW